MRFQKAAVRIGSAGMGEPFDFWKINRRRVGRYPT